MDVKGVGACEQWVMDMDVAEAEALQGSLPYEESRICQLDHLPRKLYVPGFGERPCSVRESRIRIWWRYEAVFMSRTVRSWERGRLRNSFFW